jgi:hypothetical protein
MKAYAIAAETIKDQTMFDAMKLPRRQFLHLAAGAAALPAVSRITNKVQARSSTVGAIICLAGA